MLFRGTHITQASGSLAGATYSHNRGGSYIRARATPVNSNTVQQQIIRTFFSGAQAAWLTDLTVAQRAAWDVYALGTPLTNAIGAAVNVGGKGMYTRGYVPRRQAGFAQVNPGTATTGLPELTMPGVTSLTAATGVAIVTFDPADAWAIAVGGALLMYSSRPVAASINYFKGPYRFAGKVSGAVSPPASPQNITTPFPLIAGQKVFVRFVAITPDGRLSADARFSVSAV